jgi:hypothetical protein
MVSDAAALDDLLGCTLYFVMLISDGREDLALVCENDRGWVGGDVDIYLSRREVTHRQVVQNRGTHQTRPRYEDS